MAVAVVWLAAAAPTGPLAWEPPDAIGVALSKRRLVGNLAGDGALLSWTPVGASAVWQVECTVRNGSSIIDLSPLIHRTGGYEAFDESEDAASDTNPDFYINICQPLNPMHGVPCPAGAAVCKVPVDGAPIVSRGSRGTPAPQDALSVTFPSRSLLSEERPSGRRSRE